MFLVLVPGSTHAQIVVVGDATRTYSTAFVERLQALLPNVTTRTAESYQAYRSQNVTPPPKLFIALGAEALRDVLVTSRSTTPGQSVSTGTPTPVLSLLTTQDQYATIVKTVKVSSPLGAVSALYGDPDPAIQLRLIQATFRRPVSVGVWATADTSATVTKLQTLAAALDITLVVENVALDGDRVAIAEVARATSAHIEVDAWLALPDAAIFNASNLKTILLVTYARSQPVFGFTATMVTAGAAASAWVPPAMLANDVAEMYRAIARGAEIANPRYSSHFDVVVNESVLRSLSLPVAQTLKQMRRAP